VDARREARTGSLGELIPLDEQDRRLWNREGIAEGVALVSEALPRGAVGPYQLQAAVAAVHDEAPSADETDWEEIFALYSVLLRMSDNPIVALNHAVALAMVRGPEAGLERLDALASDVRLRGTHRLDATRAHLLERAGHHDEAVAAYRRAAERTTSTPERDYLLLRAAKLGR
jgi:predicted RNA polymerase sigma factor